MRVFFLSFAQISFLQRNPDLVRILKGFCNKNNNAFYITLDVSHWFTGVTDCVFHASFITSPSLC